MIKLHVYAKDNFAKAMEMLKYFIRNFDLFPVNCVLRCVDYNYTYLTNWNKVHKIVDKPICVKIEILFISDFNHMPIGIFLYNII